MHEISDPRADWRHAGAYFWIEDTIQTGETVDLLGSAWLKDAACRDLDPDLFFAADSPKPTPARRLLTATCARCPVQQRCLEHALLTDEHGWWGGTTRKERRNLMKGL